MKRYILIAMLFASIQVNAQILEVGVETQVTLYSDSISHSDDEDCYDAELSFASNMFPFVSGMELTISLDSVTGGLDSLNIYQWPQFPWGSYVQLPIEIPIESIADDIQVDFIGTSLSYTTLYYRILATGAPAVEGESFYCSFGKAVGAPVDGCSTILHHLSGGEGSLDTIQNCSVTMPTGIIQNKRSDFIVYPNPTIGNIWITSESGDIPVRVEVLDILGRNKLSEPVIANPHQLDVNGFESGQYLLKIMLASGSYRIVKINIAK